MKVTVNLLNAHDGSILTLENPKEYHYYDHARFALQDALAQYMPIIDDGIYSACVLFADGKELNFLLSCEGNTMQELFSNYQ